MSIYIFRKNTTQKKGCILMKKNATLQIRLNELCYTLENFFDCLYNVRPEIRITGDLMTFCFLKVFVQEKDVDFIMLTILDTIGDKQVEEEAIIYSISIYQLDYFFKHYTNLRDFRILVSETCSLCHVERHKGAGKEEMYLSFGCFFIALEDMNIPSQITFTKPEGVSNIDEDHFNLIEMKFNSILSLFELTVFSEEDVSEQLKVVFCELEDFEVKITHNNKGFNQLLVFCLNDLSNEENIQIISEKLQIDPCQVSVDLDLTYEFDYKQFVSNLTSSELKPNQRNYFIRRQIPREDISFNIIKEVYGDCIKYNDSLRDFRRIYSIHRRDCSNFFANLFELEEVLDQSIYKYMDTCNEGLYFKRYFKDSELPAEHCGISMEQSVQKD